MKFKFNGNNPLKNLGSGNFLSGKTKKYAIIAIVAIIVILGLFIVLSRGEKIEFETPPMQMIENNQSEQNVPPPPPPLDEEMLKDFEKEYELNSSVSLEPSEDNYQALDEFLLQEFDKNETEQTNINQVVEVNKILPVENNLSMSQRGFSPEQIVETIDKISNKEFKCKCECPICPTSDADINDNKNTQNNGKARVEIRPDDMIIYLKAKQSLMSFDGKNLVFEDKIYGAEDIFKGWWKIEHVNKVYVRFMDDLSGYAYNLRFLNQQGLQ